MAISSRSCRAGILAGALSLVLAQPIGASVAEPLEVQARVLPSLVLQGGAAVSTAGDFNGDGFDDVVTASGVGLPARVYFGGPHPNAVADVQLAIVASSVACAGDVNGDGFDDIVAGEFYATVGLLPGAGRAALFLGGPAPDGIADLVVGGRAAYDQLGTSVAGAGDINRDGFADFIVGVPSSDLYGPDYGEAFVFLGGPGLSSTPNMRISGAAYARFGWSVGTAGDMNGDGWDEMVIGQPDTDGARGRAFVWTHAELAGTDLGGFFGWDVGTAGDVNRDGYDDLLVSARNDGTLGRAYLFFGPDFGGPPDLMLAPPGPMNGFGISASAAGDVNGDGYADVVVGAPFIYRAVGPGHALVYLGGAPMNRTEDLVLEGEYNDAFGHSVSTAGDLDGNGQDDLIVGAYSADRAYVYLSNFNRPPDCGGATAVFEGGWPPNHLLLPVAIAGVTDPDGDALSLEVTGITQDEAPGPGGLCPDARIGAGGAAWVRNERDGGGNGRVYAISFTAADGRGGSCTGVVTVCVPHDPGDDGCTDDGQDYDSLGPCRGLFPTAADPVTLGLEIVASGAGRVEFAYHLGGEADVDVGIFDVTGRRVATVDGGLRGSGDHRVTWATAGVAPGVYLARGRFGGQVETRRFVITR